MGLERIELPQQVLETCLIPLDHNPKWWGWQDSNLRSPASKAEALNQAMLQPQMEDTRIELVSSACRAEIITTGPIFLISLVDKSSL